MPCQQCPNRWMLSVIVTCFSISALFLLGLWWMQSDSGWVTSEDALGSALEYLSLWDVFLTSESLADGLSYRWVTAMSGFTCLFSHTVLGAMATTHTDRRYRGQIGSAMATGWMIFVSGCARSDQRCRHTSTPTFQCDLPDLIVIGYIRLSKMCL